MHKPEALVSPGHAVYIILILPVKTVSCDDAPAQYSCIILSSCDGTHLLFYISAVFSSFIRFECQTPASDRNSDPRKSFPGVRMFSHPFFTNRDP